MARVTSFKVYRFSVFFKNMVVPIMSFKTETGEAVSNFPRHTAFSEIFSYKPENLYPIIYDKNDARKFVIENDTEVVIVTITLVGCLIYIIWMGIRLFNYLV